MWEVKESLPTSLVSLGRDGGLRGLLFVSLDFSWGRQYMGSPSEEIDKVSVTKPLIW